MKFSELPIKLQYYLNDRFQVYGINGEEAFNTPSIFPDEVRELSPDNILRFMEKKHISHVYPKSKYPELENDLNNIILEDGAPNMHRGAEVMTSSEYDTAQDDLREDIIDGDIDEDGSIDLISSLETVENHSAIIDLFDVVLPIGIVMSAILVVKKVKNKEIVLNDAPKEYVFKVGERSVKVASVGILLASGSPVLVGGTSALIIYKSRGLIENISKGIYNVLTHETTKKVASKSGRVVIETGKFAGKTLIYSAKGAYTVATHEKTKKSINFAAKGLAKASSISAKIVSSSAKGAYKVATHEVTKKTIKKAGTGLLSTTRAGAKGIKASARGIKSLYVKLKKKKKNV